MSTLRRDDYEAIVALVTPGARVLDLGCGDGSLLEVLVARRQATVRGVEIAEPDVRACIAKGLPVRHGNIEEGLADYDDQKFDFVVLSQTLAFLNRPEPVVREMLRVGRQAVISFDNAGHWRDRWRALRGDGAGATLVSGAPRERSITLPQFRAFAVRLGALIDQTIYLNTIGRIHCCPAWRARTAVCLVRKAGA